MKYLPYQVPSTAGITMAAGIGTQQPIYDGVLSYLADAQAYASAIGAKLLNAASDSSLRMNFAGVKPSDAAQPWAIQWTPGGPWWWAGVAIKQQVAATLRLIGEATTAYPGTWVMQASGVWDFVPNPQTPTPAIKPSSAGDVAAWEAAMNMPTVTLSDVMKALAAIGQAVGAKAPQ